MGPKCRAPPVMGKGDFFIFLFFNFVFYKNIFLFSKFTVIYSGRPAAGRQGLFCKKFREKFAPGPLKDRSPGSGAAGPPGRPAAGRPPPPSSAARMMVNVCAVCTLQGAS